MEPSPIIFTLAFSLFEETNKWNVSTVSMDGICDGGTQTDINYTNTGDTVISGIIFKKLEVTSRKFSLLSSEGICPAFLSNSKILIRNTSNRIIKYNLTENKADTLFYMAGTTLNDSVKIAGDVSYSKIIKIDSVTIGSKKYKRFQLKFSSNPPFNFIDGIGFASTGPIPSSTPQCQGERISNLKCFELNQSTYIQEGSCESTYQPSSAMCSSILALGDDDQIGKVKTYFNSNTKVLETNIKADEIHVYNLSGLETASIKNSSVLTLNKLNPGLYISILLTNNRRSVYKFQIED